MHLLIFGSCLHGNGSIESNELFGAGRNLRHWYGFGNILHLDIEKKIHTFDVCVLCKLSCCLYTACLSKVNLRNTNAFEPVGLRRILDIPPVHIRNVHNGTVLPTIKYPFVQTIKQIVALPAHVQGGRAVFFNAMVFRGFTPCVFTCPVARDD